MGNNSLTREGATALAELLRGNASLTDVNINMNDVGDDGGFQVCFGPESWLVLRFWALGLY